MWSFFAATNFFGDEPTSRMLTFRFAPVIAADADWGRIGVDGADMRRGVSI